MIWLPFICLAVGLIIGLQKLPDKALKAADTITNLSLILLMLTIGANIGINDKLMSQLGTVGVNCAVISIAAILFSVLFTVLMEKTILPLEAIKKMLATEHINVNDEVNIEEEENKKASPLIWIMPISIIVGIFVGHFFLPQKMTFLLGYFLTGSLIVLYTSVGISLGSNRKVFKYVKVLGWKIILVSLAILFGSILGGFVSGLILRIPLHIPMIAASGMSYYSLTGAFMTQAYGIEVGTYGFMVNVMREFFTVVSLPILIKISKGSPIASGAAGNMDTMLVPVTKFVGAELGLVALITGTILTFAVPFLLPMLYHIFS